MADIERDNQTSSDSPEELARRLKSLLDESWSPVQEPQPAPLHPLEAMIESEPDPEPVPEQEAPAPQPEPENRAETGIGGFLKKHRRQRPQREKPSWYQPPRPPAPEEEEVRTPADDAPAAQPEAETELPPEPVQPEETAVPEENTPQTPSVPEEEAPEQPPDEAEEALEPVREEPKGTGAVLVLRDLVYILTVLTLLFTFVVRLSRVEGSSMYPSLVEGDQMILTGSFWYGEPERGDVVAVRVPTFSRDPIVKRVIAVAGDTVDIDFEAGEVTVNGEILKEPYINAPTHRSFGDQGTQFPLTVEEGHVFLLGDNRNDSYDSRYASIGQVDVRCILGKASVLVWPGWDDIKQTLNLSRVGFIR